MKNLYQPDAVEEVKRRLSKLQPDTAAAWGKMSAAQMLVHCSKSFDMALGELNPPRMLLGRILGGLAKRSLIDRGEPMRRNAVTIEEMVITAQPDFGAERVRLVKMIDRFVDAGPAGATRHPHTFMGHLEPAEWATLMYQHLDHHFRQFGV